MGPHSTPPRTRRRSSKIVETLALPPASARIVDLVATELAVIAFCDGRAILQETGLGITVAEVVAATQAELTLSDTVCEMTL